MHAIQATKQSKIVVVGEVIFSPRGVFFLNPGSWWGWLVVVCAGVCVCVCVCVYAGVCMCVWLTQGVCMVEWSVGWFVV